MVKKSVITRGGCQGRILRLCQAIESILPLSLALDALRGALPQLSFEILGPFILILVVVFFLGRIQSS